MTFWIDLYPNSNLVARFVAFQSFFKFQAKFIHWLVLCSWMEQPVRGWNLELSLTFVVGGMLRDGLSWNRLPSRWNMVSRELICWLWGSVVMCGHQCQGGVLVMKGGSWPWQFRSWWYMEIKRDQQLSLEESAVEGPSHSSAVETCE